MTHSASLLTFVWHASLVVKFVLALLILASIGSWMIIFQRVALFRRTNMAIEKFKRAFAKEPDLNLLLQKTKRHDSGLATIFKAGVQAHESLQSLQQMPTATRIEHVTRAMQIAQGKELEQLESHLAYLATVGSTAPYVGLFGTVWGIMTSFQSLGGVQQATIAMVAPGISEALIATAVGLFTAIPAVIAYNRFSNQLNQVEDAFDAFSIELSSRLEQEAYRA